MARYDYTKIISGKDLGGLALEDFCTRCFWLERNYGKAPGIFPGIFSTLDSLSKRSISRSFDERGKHPDWLPFNDIKDSVKPPRIRVPMEEYFGWTLTGDPDAVFELEDGTYHVVDYKTARFTPNQDSLLPMYKVQLNAYAMCLPKYDINPITKLSLVYCEPAENLDSDDEFKLTFYTNAHPIDLEPEIIPPLLKKARQILEQDKAPKPNPKCKKICFWVDKLES